MADCGCENGSGEDFLDEWMNGLEVSLSDSGTGGTLRLSWAAILGLLFLVLIIVTWAKDA